MSMQIIEDTPTSEYAAPASAAPLPAIATDGTDARWIDVDLTNQRVYAYEGDAVINSFLVSTGTWLTPTVSGQYKVYVKYRSAPMSGPGYYLPNVPYIMYFYKGYGLHGTYWHNSFGTPMSHGCVNLRTDEAAWLYDWVRSAHWSTCIINSSYAKYLEEARKQECGPFGARTPAFG